MTVSYGKRMNGKLRKGRMRPGEKSERQKSERRRLLMGIGLRIPFDRNCPGCNDYSIDNPHIKVGNLCKGHLVQLVVLLKEEVAARDTRLMEYEKQRAARKDNF
jgi:hypothetical protein